MDPEHAARVESLCLEALSKDAHERAAFLHEACGGDAELRRDVESLLAARTDADALLQTPSSLARTPPLIPGTRLGPYEIRAFIAAGGMGQVYKAHDTRLGRPVAIKVLPPDLAAHPDRRRRFEQEARAASALNDPHICTLHDIGSNDGTDYLVMEYLDGETLAARLRKGRLPLNQALEYATQIADALSKAHRQGIVHRDLKPGNVMLTKSGAKLLDFGLAKLRPAVLGAASTTPSALPTLEPSTEPGTLLGTVPYMAPEQIEGKEADARSDIFSFGTVLYEMVAGRRAFEGDSHANLIAAILEHEPPPLSSLQPVTPPALDRFVRRCLAKDPEQRWQSAADVAEDLRWLRDTGAVAAVHRPRRMYGSFPLAAATVLGVLLGAALFSWLRPPAPAPVAHLDLSLKPARLNWEEREGTRTPGGSRTALAWTPTGEILVFVGRDARDEDADRTLPWSAAPRRLYAATTNGNDARPVPGSEGALAPAISADGRWIAFWARGAIWKVPIAGGTPLEMMLFERDGLNPAFSAPFGLAWNDQGDLFFGSRNDRRIWRIPVSGAPHAVTSLIRGEYRHMLPQPLPGGRFLLYTVRKRAATWGDEEVVAFDLRTGARTPLLRDACDARYTPTGHLVFLRRGSLFAVAFDARRVVKEGPETPLFDEVAQALSAGSDDFTTGAGQFAFSAAGHLAWAASPVQPYDTFVVTRIDRQGRRNVLNFPARDDYYAVRLSPDESQLAVPRTDGISVCDLGGAGACTLLKGEGEASFPIWEAGGRSLLFSWLNHGRPSIGRQEVDGVSGRTSLVEGDLYPAETAAEGDIIAVRQRLSRKDIVRVRQEAGRRLTHAVLESPDLEPSATLQAPSLSGDGRWLAFQSNRTPTSKYEVYVTPYPGPVQLSPVSVGGGSFPGRADYNPAWNGNGREIFFERKGTDGKFAMMAADFTPSTPPRIGSPHVLFRIEAQGCAPVRCYDVSRDGQLFYLAEPVPQPRIRLGHLNVVLNWFEELKAKVPRK